jgi:hypothetical protein
MILIYGCEPSMHPLKNLKILNFVFVLKFKKYRMRRVALYLSLTSGSIVRDFSHCKVKISHRMLNPPTEY